MLMKKFEEMYEAPVLVAEGGLGKIYRLKSKDDGSFYALKVMTNKAVWEREAYILENADHDLFPEFIEAGEEDGSYYILMEYIWGENLSDVLTRRKGFAQPEAMRMALSVADGLGWLQTKERPVIFRDLKADNIIITPNADVRLVDLGSARFLDEDDEAITGTVGATAPEQMDGNSDLNSDVYAFGKLFHYMLTGVNPVTDPENSEKSILDFDDALSCCLELLIEDCVGIVPEDRLPDMYCVTQRMVEIATQDERGFRKMEKEAEKELKRRKSGEKIKYKKDIRK